MHFLPQVTNLFADLQPPEMMYFDFDLSLNILTLFFTEAVLLDPFITNFFSLHSTTVDTNRFDFQFTQTVSVSYLDSNRSAIIMKIYFEDLYQIQNLTLLATSSQNTFLSQNRGAVIDLAENEVLSITPLQPLQVIIVYCTHTDVFILQLISTFSNV